MELSDKQWRLAILLALSEHYCLTIQQVMQLLEWHSYPKASIKFKRLREEKLIYRIRRYGFESKLFPGDGYVLLKKGVQEIQENEFNPTFSFEPNQAARIKVNPLTHTFYVNAVF